MTEPTFKSVWHHLYDDPMEAERMEKWSNARMKHLNIEKTLGMLEMYFKNVWHHVNCADVEPVTTVLFEELYGPTIWEQLDVLAINKSNGIPFEMPKLLTELEELDSIVINDE